MESRIMGVVGNRKRRISGRSRAALSSTLCFKQDHVAPIHSRRCEETAEPGWSERTEDRQLIPHVRGYAGVRLSYHTDDGIEGEVSGYAVTKDRVFLATSVMPSSGASVILAVMEDAPSDESEVIGGKVTAVFPKADEFGFPPGFGVSVTEGFEVFGRLMALSEAQAKC